MHEKIYKFLKTIIPESLMEDKGDFYILPTVCHNTDAKDASRKLYLYKNLESGFPIFYCYTECSCKYTLWEFLVQFYKVRGKDYSKEEVRKIFYGITGPITYNENFVLKKAPSFIDPMEVYFEQNTYSDACLDMFSLTETHPWFAEGIDLEILKHFEISYSSIKEGVIIPHRRLDGALMGIRIRTYNPNRIATAKYMPLVIGEIMYSHRLTVSLYGVYQNYENIVRTKTIKLFEAEKSVLQYEQIFGRENNNSAALCGSIISSWLIQFLISVMAVENIYLMLDKEYDSDPISIYNYIKKMKMKAGILNQTANVFIAIDEAGEFPPKSSPTDLTFQKYNTLKYIKLGD
jgi:hypothetical protein